MLEYNGVPGFSTIGGIQAMSGQKKNGKSFVFSMLMAAILGGDPERTRVPDIPSRTKVPERTIGVSGTRAAMLYVDTEMEKAEHRQGVWRALALCGWDTRLLQDCFNILWLGRPCQRMIRKPCIQAAFDLIKGRA